MSLCEAELTESYLATLFDQLPERCIILLEDIDTADLRRDIEESFAVDTIERPGWKIFRRNAVSHTATASTTGKFIAGKSLISLTRPVALRLCINVTQAPNMGLEVFITYTQPSPDGVLHTRVTIARLCATQLIAWFSFMPMTSQKPMLLFIPTCKTHRGSTIPEPSKHTIL